MSKSNGEIVLQERYGSSGQEIYYVKPHNQSGLVTVERSSGRDAVRWLAALFLPHGYPDSVSSDYANYQLWDTAQAFCSTISGTLATQEVLRGVGVGDASASPAAATVTWVFKESCGHLGRIFFAASHGAYLDAYSKKWRLYADCLNDAAICLEMALPLFREHTAALLCLTTSMKAVVGVAGGATRAALTQHHAVRFNMADVAAKDSAQETAVNLVASLVALLIVTYLGPSLVVFGVMVTLHVSFNYLAVRAVCLRTFNEPRLLHTLHGYLRRGQLAAPPDANRCEPLLATTGLDVELCGSRVEMGVSAREVPAAVEAAAAGGGWRASGGERYAVWPDAARRRMRVLLARAATADDVLCGYFHAVLLSCLLRCVDGQPLAVCEGCAGAEESRFARACRSARAGAWSGGGGAGRPVPALLTFVNGLVREEWAQLSAALREAGWNLERHLLLADEWRVEPAQLA